MLDRPKGSAVLTGGVANLMNPQVRRRTISFVAVQGIPPSDGEVLR